jgi:hypothetical protein
MRSLKIGALTGLLGGGVIAFAMTLLDWWENPSGLFHDAQGTRWDTVAETAMSWFWPVALLFFIVGFGSHLLLMRSRSRNQLADN